MSTETIFALSTGSPPAAIAIVRISGVRAFAAAAEMVGVLPPARSVALRAVRDPRDGSLLDRALVLCFAAPRTATGEDLVELHLHGGRAVVSATLAALAAQPGLRAAEAGEFTRRALENGVIDLTAAEGLGDLLSAETETQRRAALRMAEGGLRAMIEAWSTLLIGIAARVEAQLDFSDEDDVAEEAMDAIVAAIAEIGEGIDRMLAAPSVERLKEGIRVVIAGPSNSGKSTLLNALAQRDVAIVSPISGTTRDRIEVPVERGGVAYVLTDTAGLSETPNDDVERIGIARAREAAAAADVVLWLGDDQPDAGLLHVLSVHARADLPARAAAPQGRLKVSAHSGEGLDALWIALAARCSSLLPATDAIATNRRQRTLLAACSAHLRPSAGDPLIVAEEVRAALRVLDSITGRSGVEHVLDALFATFCIGK